MGDVHKGGGIRFGGSQRIKVWPQNIALEDAPKLLQAIATAVTQRDAIALRHAAHTLKSTSTTLGAKTLSQFCKDLEVMGKAGAIADAEALVSLLEGEYAKVQAALLIER